MSDHTKEPWYLARNGAGSIVCAKAATLLPLSIGARCLDVVARTDWGRGREDEANAKRIVACVSACDGIETKYLEHASLDFGKELRAENDSLVLKTFRLEAALREALGAWQARCKWVDDGITDNVPINDERNRIIELRNQFLDAI